MVEAIKQGFPQREIAEASFRYQSEVEAGQRLVVGVNSHTVANEETIPTLKIDPALERQQIERVRAVRERRPAAPAESALAVLRRAASGTENLMPPIIDAARADVTMGEICDALRETWGTWRETPVF